jgi:methylmalonyl-CoA mutase N-terminal domain/subunit
LPEIDVFRYPEGVEEKQIERVKKLRAERDPQKVESALNALRDACKREVNVVPYSIDCARANCTEGELFKVFKDVFGLWKTPSFW